MMNDLKNLRKEIDLIDDELMKLLIKRFHLSIEVKKVKQINNIAVLDNKREQEIIDKVLNIDEASNIKDAVLEVYQCLLKTSKDLQK